MAEAMYLQQFSCTLADWTEWRHINLLRMSLVGSCDKCLLMFISAPTNSSWARRRGAPQWQLLCLPANWHTQPLSNARPDDRSPASNCTLPELVLRVNTVLPHTHTHTRTHTHSCTAQTSYILPNSDHSPLWHSIISIRDFIMSMHVTHSPSSKFSTLHWSETITYKKYWVGQNKPDCFWESITFISNELEMWLICHFVEKIVQKRLVKNWPIIFNAMVKYSLQMRGHLWRTLYLQTWHL